MMSSSIGSEHGVLGSDLDEIKGVLNNAHEHLYAVIKDERIRIKQGLEWTQLPYQDKKLIKEIKTLGSQIRNKYENVMFLGIGGSYLGLKAAQDAFCPPYYNEFSSLRKDKPRIYFEGNNLDPDTLSVLLKQLNPKKTFVVVISKSGETTETKAVFMAIEKWLKNVIGKNYAKQVIAITDPESGSLRKKVNKQQLVSKLFFRNLPLLKGVGGRFSEFNMGLLHLAVIGVDIDEVLKGAGEMAERCASCEILKNPAYLYAALHYILYKKKEKSIAVMMPFSETLKSTADWYVQLLAESLGKKYARKIQVSGGLETWQMDLDKIVNVGRTPVSCRGTNDLHSIQQNNIEGRNDKVVTFIKVEKFKNEIKVPVGDEIISGRKFSELIALAQEATVWALAQEARPSCTITLPEVSPYYWGGLLFFLQMATAFEGELLGVNAFDQPGVEGYKNYMYYKLGKTGISADISENIKKHPLVKDNKFIL